MNTTVDPTKCQACRESDCDECLMPDVSREDSFPVCCCGRTTMGPSTAQGRAALIRAQRAHESAVRATIDDSEVRTDGSDLSEAQRDGRGCIECGGEVGTMLPTSERINGVQMFACADKTACVERQRDAESAQDRADFDGTDTHHSVTDFETSEAPTVDEVERVSAWLDTDGVTLVRLREAMNDDGLSYGEAYWTGYRDGQSASIADASPRDLAHLCEAIGRRMGELRDGTPKPRSTAVAPHQKRHGGGLVLAVVAVVVALGFGTVGGWLVRDADQPHCPSEDSCTADYFDGQWHIEQVQP
jgi:hypothetical protein